MYVYTFFSSNDGLTFVLKVYRAIIPSSSRRLMHRNESRTRYTRSIGPALFDARSTNNAACTSVPHGSHLGRGSNIVASTNHSSIGMPQ